MRLLRVWQRPSIRNRRAGPTQPGLRLPEKVQSQAVEGGASLHYYVQCLWRYGGGGHKPQENWHLEVWDKYISIDICWRQMGLNMTVKTISIITEKREREIHIVEPSFVKYSLLERMFKYLYVFMSHFSCFFSWLLPIYLLSYNWSCILRMVIFFLYHSIYDVSYLWKFLFLYS